MQLLEKPVEQPWAYATRKGFNGEAPGLFFRYFKTREEAEKSLAWMERKKRWHGPIEHRPGESYHAGYISNVEMNMTLQVGDVVTWRDGKRHAGRNEPLGIANCKILELGVAEDGAPAARLRLPAVFSAGYKQLEEANAYLADLEK